MNREFLQSGTPRILLDYPVEALAAIVLRHLGGGYLAPERRDIERYPALCLNWVADFRATFDCVDENAQPIGVVFRANPFSKNGKDLDAPEEGEVNYPLFAIWRSNNTHQPFTVQADTNRIKVMWAWVLQANKNTERIWPLLTHFDWNFRRAIDGIKRCKADRELLKAAGISDICRETWTSENGYKGPAGHLLYPTVVGSFEFQFYWQRTEFTLGLNLEPFNHAYVEYFLRSRIGDGSLTDTRLSPPLMSRFSTLPTVPGVS